METDIVDSFWTDWGSLIFKWLLLVTIPVIYYWLWSRSTFVQLVNAIPGPPSIPFLGNVLDLYVDRDGACLIMSSQSRGAILKILPS